MLDSGGALGSTATVLSEVTDFCRLVWVCVPELEREYQAMAVGAGEASLSRRGVTRVVEVIERLQPYSLDHVFAADVPQAAAVGQALAEARGLVPVVEPRLRDQNLGAWQGRTWEEIAQVEPDAVREFFQGFAERVPGGETGEALGSAVERLLAWWNELAPTVAGQTVLAVSSGTVIAGFAAAMLGMRLSRSLSLRLPAGGIGVIDVFANGVRVPAWNADALVEASSTAQ